MTFTTRPLAMLKFSRSVQKSIVTGRDCSSRSVTRNGNPIARALAAA
ncbi:MAG: hypothetical protein LDL31_11445 [Prosthecobacter sp.]|nr:hypothetical protein [Prosthecobacter sp.]